MRRNAWLFCSLVVTVIGLAGCSGSGSKEARKGAPPPDTVQGKAQVVMVESAATDSAMNAGGPSVYLIQGVRRYRLFFNKPEQVEPGKEYIAEGVYAQKMIDEIGDPANGKNGYPLQESCDKVVRTAWPGLAFDVTDLHASILRSRIKRYPARPVILVHRLRAVTPGDDSLEAKKVAEAKEEEVPEITVPAEKQKALMTQGPVVQPAPLWEPAGGTSRCKVLIGSDGKIAELETGAQLCESVPWDQFQFQPTVQKGRPVAVHTEVEIRFEPRK